MDYKRIFMSSGIERSPRWVKIKYNGDCKKAVLLHQYGPEKLPTYNFPQEKVQINLQEQTQKIFQCLCMGLASNFSVRTGNRTYDYIAWTITDPIPEKPEEKFLFLYLS
jgi:uncharacterized protein (DUF427 family)